MWILVQIMLHRKRIRHLAILLHEFIHHLFVRQPPTSSNHHPHHPSNPSNKEDKTRTKVTKTHIILTPTHAQPTITPHTLHIPRPPAHQPVPLQALIILPEFRELAKRIPCRRALRTT
jgi:hypothetical protein